MYKMQSKSQQINYLTIVISALSILGLLLNGNHVCHGYSTLEEEQPNFINLAAAAGAPLITPLSKDISLEKNLNFTLRCVSNTAITWIIPYEFNLTHEIKNFKSSDPKRPFGSQLFLENLTTKNVGYYYCVKADSYNENKSKDPEKDANTLLPSLVEDLKSSRIYIYIEDWTTDLFPFPKSRVITGFQYSDIIIPCKPTSPDFEVKLRTSHQGTLFSQNSTTYHPKLGFVIKLQDKSDAGVYICYTSILMHKNDGIDFNVDVLHSPFDSTVAQMMKKPTINSTSKGHAVVGESFELLCRVEVENDVTFDLIWEIPPNSSSREENRTVVVGPTKENNENNQSKIYGVSTLYVTNVQPKDTGQYKCKVLGSFNKSNANKYLMIIMGHNESFISISAPDGPYLIGRNVKSKAEMVVNYRGYPPPSLRWLRQNKYYLFPIPKYDLVITDDSTILKINDLTFADSGTYVLRADNGILTKELTFNLSIKDKLRVNIRDVFILSGEEAIMKCVTEALPAANVTWTFTPCSIQPIWPTCEERSIQRFYSTRTTEGYAAYIQIHELNFRPEQPGIVRCLGYNDNGNTTREAKVIIFDLTQNMTMYGFDKKKEIVSGDKVTLNCAAIVYYYSNNLEWYKDGHFVKENDDIEIMTSLSNFSYKSSLKFKSIKFENSGHYECRGYNSELRFWELNIPNVVNASINVFQPPLIDFTNIKKEKMQILLDEQLQLECKANGKPMPTVTWHMNEMEIHSHSSVFIEKNNTVLRIPSMKPENEGLYKCVMSNRFGSIEKSTKVYILNKTELLLAWILGIVAILLISSVLVIYLYVRVKRERAVWKEWKAAGLDNFQKGDIEHINPALPLDEQAELLPYDKRFEFPRDKLRLGKQLGTGAFGVVLKASAQGINSNEKETIVAVKMVKRTADNEIMKALVSELKIMVHLGRHLNVVNLLGAVTNNIAKREVMVIVEYCRYGNVQNYLLRTRKHFINQINADTDLIDPTIMHQLHSDDFEFNSAMFFEHINPALPLDEQAELLPYDKRFEFPRDKLRLGKQLGTGAFGVVLKASAQGINSNEKETIVAVKMVKRTADNEIMKALVSELKIMVHLGRHLNVVNLLGAVTNNIAKREVMVIVEYCRYGNVQNYLLRTRKHFINQINADTDLIDPTIMHQLHSDDFEFNSNRSENYQTLGSIAGSPKSAYLYPSNLYDDFVETWITEYNEITTIPKDEDQILSVNSVQPAWRSNYITDSSEYMETTTTHLISWAFQVARGMDYLASRKVLHGDLAARNILLCENNVVKICDFGLARSMYKRDTYKKKEDAPLPIKWLALESLSDKIFSTYTDVWSFGIVLWELFSLAEVPYPGMDTHKIYSKLKDGYRMQKPQYANQELYDIMLECWRKLPQSRPLFDELERKFAKLLVNEVTNYYLDLNEPYLRANKEYFKTKDTDYLAMINPLDMETPSTPRCTKGKNVPEITTDDYLKMSPKAGSLIFSPTRPKDDSIKANFESLEQNANTISNNLDSSIKNRKMSAIPEEIPTSKLPSVAGGGAGQSDSDEVYPDPYFANKRNFNKTTSPVEVKTKVSDGDDRYVSVKAMHQNIEN